MPNHTSRLCRWCRSDLIEGAVVCATCGRHQNGAVVGLEQAGILVSLIMIGVILIQLLAASSERVETKIALRSARTAQEQALENNVRVWENLLRVQHRRMNDVGRHQPSQLSALATERDKIRKQLSLSKETLKEFREAPNLAPK